jgi:ATP-dependent Zn protease
MAVAVTPDKKQPWSFDPAIEWEMLDAAGFNEALKMWEGVGPGHLPRDVNIFVADLPFYSRHKLYCVLGTVDNELRHCFMLHGEQTAVLNGNSSEIHLINAYDPVNITKDNSACYLRFFCSFVHADLGPFLPIERPDQVKMPANLAGQDAVKAQNTIDLLRNKIAPISLELLDVDNQGVFNIIIYLGGTIFTSQMRVHRTGMVEMLSDDPVLTDIPNDMIVGQPPIYKIDDLIVEPLDAKYTHPDGVKIREKAPSPPPQSNYAPPKSNLPQLTLPSDREITRHFIEVLVRETLDNSKHWDFINTFNQLANAQDALLDFVQYVLEYGPVVLVESELPFIEKEVADLITQQAAQHLENQEAEAHRIHRGSDVNDFNLSNTILTLNPNDLLHSNLSIEHIAFEISKSKNAAIIGAYQKNDLQNVLCDVVEFELKLSRLSPKLFEKLFKKILGSNLPRNWKKNGVQWLHYLTPQDFHQPCKMRLTGTKAYQYLHQRVKERLRKMDAKDSPNLADLHGMTEAKQIAEDLIVDIQAALKKQIPWSAVDRGMLLSGPPGTGKTTLAKAIAKSCGVRFIACSAAEWQSAGHLGDHLRAMRASFAEARRYAPAIIFIDEFDSFSNRNAFSGSYSQYHTEVVNALLEQIQGFNSQQPVFVIGATNHPEMVDPALRRAGRLDKLVYIPRPNVEALKSIYEYYLSKTELLGKKVDAIDTKFLAGLSFGLTGADVESMVRGGARRARKSQQALNQQHLVDEITGKSRQETESNRLTPEEMRLIAVHESGHALMQHLNGNQEIAYVSIVPRENGSLGFVANMPSSSKSFTRKQYAERLQTLLAGRAAEEIVFGKEHVSGGAGGDSTGSDLAIATRIASDMICRMGMGRNGSLLWKSAGEQQALEDEIEKLLQEAYNTALTKLEANRKPLDALTHALVEKQELMGSEVMRIVEAK